MRLETRFAGSLLRVRIFPDEIFADTHEPGLTPEESTDGTAYVAAMQAGTDAERSAWGQLAARWTAPRAAFIAQAAAAGATQAQAESWTRAAEATLPDHWIVRAFEGANAYTVTSGPVRKPLALTLSPAATLQDRVTIAGTLTIDEALQWTVDFAAAEAAGMAVTIDLTRPDQVPAAPPDPSAGVDLVLVIGVSDSAAPADGAAQLQALIDAHHWTRGVAFLRPGTPTSNTPRVPAAFPPPDPGGTASFAVERGAPLVAASSPPGANGRLFTEALGLPLAVAGHLDGAGTDGDAAAAAMNDALWPATLGYCMEQLMAPTFSAADVAARAHVLDRPGASRRTAACPPRRPRALRATAGGLAQPARGQQARARAARAARRPLRLRGRRRTADHRRLRRPRRRPAQGAGARRELKHRAHPRAARPGVHREHGRVARPRPRRGAAGEPDRPRGHRCRPARHDRAWRRHPAWRPRREQGR